MGGSGEPPPAKRPRLSSKDYITDISCLNDDLLIQVLLRLPSPAALVRAACACPLWRRLASDPDFRRRFRTIHPAPILGIFVNPPKHVVPSIPSFVPAPRDDADMAALVQAGDFFLSSLYVSPRVPPCWQVVDSRGGYLLLMNRLESLLVLLNPLSGKVEGYFDLYEVDILEDVRGARPYILDARLMCIDDYPTIYQIFCLAHDESRVRIAVFTNEFRDGFILPWIDAPGRPNPDDQRLDWLCNGMQAGHAIFWFYRDASHVIILDIRSLDYYAEEIHPSLRLSQFPSFVLGEDSNDMDGLPCIVHAQGNGHDIVISSMVNGVHGTLNRIWNAGRVIDLGPEFHRMLMDIPVDNFPADYGDHVLATLRDGSVYFTTAQMGENVEVPVWVASLRLETGDVERRRTMEPSYHTTWLGPTSF